MPNTEHLPQTATCPDPAMAIDLDATLFVALELSLSNWVIVASAPGEAKASKHGVTACDGSGLLSLLKRLRERAERRLRHPVKVLVMQEAGRDGFWVHRWLEAHAIRSVVVDPASIAVNRRSRRAKTDRIDAEAMLRTLMAWARGERQVCAMVHPPTREAEDARRLNREREALLAERIRHANRIKGLLATQGVFGFEPTLRDRRARLAAVRTPEGAALPPRSRPRSGAKWIASNWPCSSLRRWRQFATQRLRPSAVAVRPATWRQQPTRSPLAPPRRRCPCRKGLGHGSCD
jgi:transposase